MIERLLKRIIIRMILGSVGCLLGTLGLLLLVILLCIAVAQAGTASAGPGSDNTNANQTQHATGNKNDAVVNAARTLVKPLYACGDDQRYKCYDTSFPGNVLQYLYNACGDSQCPYVQSGNFQCVSFVRGVYWLAGQTLPVGPNAVDFWSAYHARSGWQEIAANGTPHPGDIAVFSGPPANPDGHVAVIVDVALPKGNGTGYIQLTQANGLAAVENLSLSAVNQTLWQVRPWAGYGLLGYIRNAAKG